MKFRSRSSAEGKLQSTKLRPSYYQANQSSQNPQPRSKGAWTGRISKATKWIFARLFLLALLAAFLYWVIGTDATPKIVAGNLQYRPISAYQSVTSSHINRLKDSNKLSFDSDSITNSLTQTFPEVSSASVELPFVGRQPVIRLDIATPAFLFVNHSGQKYVVSSQGRVIGAASEFPQIKGLVSVQDNSGLEAGPGAIVLGQDQVEFIKVIAGQMASAGIKVSRFSLPSASRELDMYASGQPYFVKFDLGGDSVGEAGSYLAARHYFNSRHLTPGSYVDVRVSGKIFYK